MVRLYDVFESKQRIGIVLERLEGGELLDVVIAKGSFSEHEAAQCLAQILSALQYIHSLGIVHRDIKPENLMFGGRTPSDWSPTGTALKADSLKLTDFGLAEHCEATSGLKELCGTPVYSAPEMFAGKEYGFSIDLWSTGCILYAMLSGTVPFDFNEKRDLKVLGRQIIESRIVFDDRHWLQISDKAKDLVLRFLGMLP